MLNPFLNFNKFFSYPKEIKLTFYSENGLCYYVFILKADVANSQWEIQATVQQSKSLSC